MDDRSVARLIGAGRLGFGVALLAAPTRTSRVWLGPTSGEGPVQVFTRAIGARDLVLGLGLLRAAEAGDPVAPWLRAGAVVDALDTLSTIAAFRRLPKVLRFGVTAIGVGAAVAGFRLAQAVD